MQITCKLPTGAKYLGPFDSVAGLRKWAQPTWYSPWDQGSPACPVYDGEDGAEDGSKFRGNGSTLSVLSLPAATLAF